MALTKVVPAGCLISATATDAAGNTSELSTTVTTTSADGTPTLVVRDHGVVEGDSGTVDILFAVELSHDAAQPVTVSYATQDGTATAGADYQAKASSITIPAGQSSATIAITVNGDVIEETDEDFLLNVSATKRDRHSRPGGRTD